MRCKSENTFSTKNNFWLIWLNLTFWSNNNNIQINKFSSLLSYCTHVSFQNDKVVGWLHTPLETLWGPLKCAGFESQPYRPGSYPSSCSVWTWEHSLYRWHGGGSEPSAMESQRSPARLRFISYCRLFNYITYVIKKICLCKRLKQKEAYFLHFSSFLNLFAEYLMVLPLKS